MANNDEESIVYLKKAFAISPNEHQINYLLGKLYHHKAENLHKELRRKGKLSEAETAQVLGYYKLVEFHYSIAQDHFPKL